MPDYGEILAFLAANPPQLAAERELHASLLELIAKCLRSEAMTAEEDEASPDELQTRSIRWMDLTDLNLRHAARCREPQNPWYLRAGAMGGNGA